MSRIPLEFVELHNPMFFAGKNFAVKLDPSHIAGLELEYDRAEKELFVHWGGKVGIVPSSNISCMVEGTPKVKAQVNTHPIVAGIQSAQVETPMSHVHAGPGKGLTGKRPLI